MSFGTRATCKLVTLAVARRCSSLLANAVLYNLYIVGHANNQHINHLMVSPHQLNGHALSAVGEANHLLASLAL